MAKSFDELKTEAQDLGLDTTGIKSKDAMQKLIDGDEQKEDVQLANTSTEEAPVEDKLVERVNKRVKRDLSPKMKKVQEIKRKALQKKVVKVYNNDERERDFKTTFSRVQNSYFGNAKVIPIGKPWVLEQMHIDNLKRTKIMAFVEDDEGNKSPEEKNKFTIEIIHEDAAQYEQEVKEVAAKANT